MVKADEWVVECWIDGEFDFSTTLSSYEEALNKFEDERKFYKEDKGWAYNDTWQVRMYEVVKTLVLHDEGGKESEDDG